MLKVSVVSHPDGKARLGEVYTFSLEKQTPELEIRSFLKHERLFFLKPLLDWTRAETFWVFPEASGHYMLIVEWRAPDGSRGFVEQPFRVFSTVTTDETEAIDNGPRIVKCDRATRIWVPSEWEARLLQGYEDATLKYLEGVVKPGWVAYDVGASLGVYSLRLSSLVGSGGQVYSIEANPVCVYFLQATLQLNKVSNCEILPVAILNGEKLAYFTINYSNFGLGLTQDPSILGGKTGHEIAVRSTSFDALVETHNLRKPDFVKIDIEGAEGSAVAGMARTIDRHRPVILLEVHGTRAAGETFRAVDWGAYRFEHPAGGEKFHDAADLLAWFPDNVLQVICLPK